MGMDTSKMLAVLLLCVLVPLSTQQCLTSNDEVRQVSELAHQSLLRSELQFSSDLLRTVSSLHPDQNVFFSPTSVFRALLLAYFVAANHTEDSLRQALHLDVTKDKLDLVGAYTLENYYQKLRSIKSSSYQLSNANRMFVAKNLRLKQCMKVLFSEEIYPANFQENLKGVVKKINNWVAGLTRNVIKDFLSEDSVSTDTELVLVNAAYFKGNWKSPFDVNDTEHREFHLSNGTTVKTPLMYQEGKFKSKVDKKLGAEVLELPYNGNDISMLVFLPIKSTTSAIPDLLRRLNLQTLQDTVAMLATRSPHPLSVTIPRFTVEHSLELTSILESMNVGDLFKRSADLSTLTGSPGLSFSEAIHKAKIQVDEKGTEAAAATAVISARIGADSFIADRPFVYLLYDKTSNILLFFGIFNSPQSA